MASEVDRYCSWPGQACGYKVGHQEIVRQRTRAQAALGPRYDLRDFNDAVVKGGNVPLDVLAKNVDEYIARRGGPEAERRFRFGAMVSATRQSSSRDGLLRYVRSAVLTVTPRPSAGRLDAVFDMLGEFGEIGDEQVDQLGRGAVIVFLVGPGRARVEDRAVDAGHRDRHFEAEVGILAELGVVEAAVERGVEQARASP